MAALLSAVDHHLGACFFGIPTARIAAAREAFGVPPNQLSVGVVSLGYPVPAPAIGSPTRRPRKAPSEVIHRGTWYHAIRSVSGLSGNRRVFRYNFVTHSG